jgi:hypothetical protein
MRLIMEQWRQFLTEDIEMSGWGPGNKPTRIPAANVQGFHTVHLAPSKRKVVVIQTRTEGPTAFYESTGTGTGELWESEGMWLPIGGVAYSESRDAAWVVKLPSGPKSPKGKFPKEGTELYQIGEWLAKSSPFPMTDWKDWVRSRGMPSYDDVERLTNDELGRLEYGAMALNAYLKSMGALKVDWADGRGFYGAELQGTRMKGVKYTWRDVKKLGKS